MSSIFALESLSFKRPISSGTRLAKFQWRIECEIAGKIDFSPILQNFACFSRPYL